MPRPVRIALSFAAFAIVAFLGLAGSAQAAPARVPSSLSSLSSLPAAAPATLAPALGRGGPSLDALVAPSTPSASTSSTGGSSGNASVNVNLGNSLSSPSQSIVIIIVLTLLTAAPTLLIMMTSFTRIIIVLSLTRQALGLTSVPPNQVLAGLALFLSLFIMQPTINAVNKDAVQPYIHHTKTFTQAYDAAQVPLKGWMLKQTRSADLSIFVNASGQHPAKATDVSMAALIPAFILSELETAMIIGFVIFIPFLVIDLIVSSSLMSMGMMMLPPVTVSLPFKILLFVLVDGWGLVIQSLLSSFR